MVYVQRIQHGSVFASGNIKTHVNPKLYWVKMIFICHFKGGGGDYYGENTGTGL